jgi:hypothetical protein
MEAWDLSETLVTFYQTTWPYTPEENEDNDTPRTKHYVHLFLHKRFVCPDDLVSLFALTILIKRCEVYEE